MPKKVLVVDDEKLIVKGLKFSLEQDGMQVDCAYDGREALEMVSANQYDIILLDVMMPVMDGYQVCQAIRGFSNVPIIMLTAKSEDIDKILGLDYGADDYMTKPFNVLEVKARIKAICRRYNPSLEMPQMQMPAMDTQQYQDPYQMQQGFVPQQQGFYPQQNMGYGQPIPENVVAGPVVLEPLNRRTLINGKQYSLTTKEFDVLLLLVTNPGRVFSREDLLHEVWGFDYPGDGRTVDVHVRRLREKIEPNPKEPTYIHTRWGTGYYFALEGAQ